MTDKNRVAMRLVRLAKELTAMSEGQFLADGKDAVEEFRDIRKKMGVLSSSARGLEDLYIDTPLEKEASGIQRLSHMISAKLDGLGRDFEQLERLLGVIDDG